MTRPIYADICIEISHEQLDRPFQYIIPDKMITRLKVGDSVTVPFGVSNRTIRGYCIDIKDEADYPVEKLKEIIDINEDHMNIEGSLIALAWWIKKRYGGTMIQALKTVIPVKRKMNVQTTKRVDLAIDKEELLPIIDECSNKHQVARLRVLSALLTEHTLPYDLVRKKLNVSAQSIKALAERGIIEITETEYFRNPVVRDSETSSKVNLSETQNSIITRVIDDYKSGKPGQYLIHGITGSGKTEVYLGIAEETVKLGRQVIVLIPEISLTYQTLLRFYKRFGDRVSVVNSSMSAGERYDQYIRAMRGDIDVIIGPRSALFIPFENLGAIIIDEEHENSYKSENTPRYHARECAEYIATSRGVSLVLGSATPSMDAYYKAKSGQYVLFNMSERLTGGDLPQVYTVDLREELRLGNRTIFSNKLRELMEDRLNKHEQIMLFINRRGYAGFISCRNCGHVMKCKHCDVSLTEHKNGKLVCHYCGYSEPKPRTCPECGSKYISGFKVGTEQIEQQVLQMFPSSRVLRMDADTTSAKGSMEKILSAFQDQEADVLVGTQMIVKGHDFPNVTLVGILAADLSLGAGDYHSAERTFQLLTQAAGRAGRGEKPGEVVIQTYQPEHYSVVNAAAQDYVSFYEEEIMYRELANYPPVGHMLAILFLADSEASGLALADNLRHLSEECLTHDIVKGYCIGPAPAGISKIKDKYRFVLYIKHNSIDMLVKIKDLCEKYTKDHPDRRVLTFYDMDPSSSL